MRKLADLMLGKKFNPVANKATVFLTCIYAIFVELRLNGVFSTFDDSIRISVFY